jgi:hypothetical protein
MSKENKQVETPKGDDPKIVCMKALNDLELLQSPYTDELYQAKFEVLRNMPSIQADGSNPIFRNSKYMTLHNIASKIESVLFDYSLVIRFQTDLDNTLYTTLLHVPSMQWERCRDVISHKHESEFNDVSNNPYFTNILSYIFENQEVLDYRTKKDLPGKFCTLLFGSNVNLTQKKGSHTTYLKRQAICNLFNIVADEDEDGNTPQQYKDHKQKNVTPDSKESAAHKRTRETNVKEISDVMDLAKSKDHLDNAIKQYKPIITTLQHGNDNDVKAYEVLQSKYRDKRAKLSEE